MWYTVQHVIEVFDTILVSFAVGYLVSVYLHRD